MFKISSLAALGVITIVSAMFWNQIRYLPCYNSYAYNVFPRRVSNSTRRCYEFSQTRITEKPAQQPDVSVWLSEYLSPSLYYSYVWRPVTSAVHSTIKGIPCRSIMSCFDRDQWKLAAVFILFGLLNTRVVIVTDIIFTRDAS